MIKPSRTALAAAALATVALAACETTQDKAAKLQAEGAALAQDQVGVVVAKPNKDIKVVGSTLLQDEYGDAVVVELQNTSNRPLVDLPINIHVLDAKGRPVFSNDVSGLDAALTHVPFMKPGETTYWVNDQIQPSGEPKSVKVEVGEPEGEAAGQVPELKVSTPRIHNDPSGIEIEGRVSNESDIDQSQLVLFAIAKRGDEIVAAGRGEFKNLAAGGKPLPFNIFVIGDPRGAQLQVLAPPAALQ